MVAVVTDALRTQRARLEDRDLVLRPMTEDDWVLNLPWRHLHFEATQQPNGAATATNRE